MTEPILSVAGYGYQVREHSEYQQKGLALCTIYKSAKLIRLKFIKKGSTKLRHSSQF